MGPSMWQIGIERHCVGCKKAHSTIVWYYRDKDGEREWLCGGKFLILREADRDVWHPFPVV